MVTVILKIREGKTLADVAGEVKATFGKGGNPDAPIVEEHLGFVNTPLTPDGYVRCLIDQSFGVALDYIESVGGSTTADLIHVEWEGQEMFQTGVDADGNPEYLGMIAL